MSDHELGVPAQAAQPNPKFTELAQRLSGKWRVKGPGIDGRAEYKLVREGLLLVMSVDFVVNGTEMKVIQHVAYDRDTGLLRARYMDTSGDESTYTWVLDGKNLRVSLGDEKSDTFSTPGLMTTTPSTSARGTIRTMVGATQPKNRLYTPELREARFANRQTGWSGWTAPATVEAL